MVVLRGQDPSMYKCRVLYIGSAPPVETLKGIEALQKPLRERYPMDMNDVEGIDATLTVLPDALEMTYVASSQVVQFPLAKLTICAAMRAVTAVDGTSGEKSRQFVPVNTVQTDTDQPAIFSCIIRRNQGRQIAECHAFICNSTRDALHLVNTTASANMALKQSQQAHVQADSTRYENGVPVVHALGGDYTTNGTVENGNFEYRGDTIYVKSGATVEPSVQQQFQNITINDPDHYAIRTPQVPPTEGNTIYITFDKTNLIPKDEGNFQVQSSGVVERPMAIVPRPMAVPRPVLVQRALPPPPPPMMMRPVLYRQPPPPRPVLMVRPPPPPQPIYTRRVMSPPPRMVPARPVYVRSRARSASPVYGVHSDIKTRISRKNIQPKWNSHHSDIADYRQPRYTAPLGPMDFRTNQGRFMNERAFSRRVNTDQRIAMAPYGYPTAYDFHDAMMYNKATTKSNPRYSSSSDEDQDFRFSKSKR